MVAIDGALVTAAVALLGLLVAIVPALQAFIIAYIHHRMERFQTQMDVNTLETHSAKEDTAALLRAVKEEPPHTGK